MIRKHRCALTKKTKLKVEEDVVSDELTKKWIMEWKLTLHVL